MNRVEAVNFIDYLTNEVLITLKDIDISVTFSDPITIKGIEYKVVSINSYPGCLQCAKRDYMLVPVILLRE